MENIIKKIEGIVFSVWGCIIGLIVSGFIPVLYLIFIPAIFVKLFTWSVESNNGKSFINKQGQTVYKCQVYTIIKSSNSLVCKTIGVEQSDVPVNKIESIGIIRDLSSWRLAFYGNGTEIGHFNTSKKSAKYFKDALNKDLQLV